LYLARQGCSVHAVDASGVACEVLRDRARSLDDLQHRITVEQAHLDTDELPDARYDVVIDSYVSCHLLDGDARRRYLSGLRRLLRRGGTLYTACMGTDDEYYAAHASGTAGAIPIAVDPLNGVAKLLQPRVLFREGLAEFSQIEAVTAERFVDLVAGQTYRREVLAAIVRG
jgi:SAM-dependent methyltransferase